jgi:hypothetical protein
MMRIPPADGPAAAVGKPGSEAHRAAEHQAFDPAGDVARRPTEKQVEGIEAEQLGEGSYDQPAQCSPRDSPAAILQRPYRRDAKTYSRTAHQRRRDGEPKENQHHRNRARAGFKRLRCADQAIEKPPDHSRHAGANRPCAANQEEVLPTFADKWDGTRRTRSGLHRRDEAIAVLWHGFDVARVRSVVAELPSKRLDALGQRFVGDGDTAPHFVEEAVLGNEPAPLTHEQRKRIEITGVELQRHFIERQPAVLGIELEAVEAKAAGRHFSAKPHDLLMPCIAGSAMLAGS